MEMMTKVVHENLKEAQRKQKAWYDQNARERTLQEGDLVLVLLPTSSNKLAAKWQGPYKVERRVGKVNYVVDMHDRRKRRRIFHINMLREFHSGSGPSAVLWTEGGEEETDSLEDIPVWRDNEEGSLEAEVKTGDQLSGQQRQELHVLLGKFCTLFSNRPGRTSLMEHDLQTGTARPVKLAP